MSACICEQEIRIYYVNIFFASDFGQNVQRLFVQIFGFFVFSNMAVNYNKVGSSSP